MWKAPGTRTFPTVTLAPGQSETQEVGITVCPKIGWVLVYRSFSPGNNQVCDVTLNVAAPGADGLIGNIARFSPGPIGQVFIPWPRITATINPRPVLPGNIAWRATYLPVDNPSDADGVPSIVDVAQPQAVDPAVPHPAIVAPPGATHWCVFPDATNGTQVVAQTTDGVLTTLGSWSLGATGLPQPDLTAMGWKRTTTGGFQLFLTGLGPGISNVTVFWKMDFRNWGDSGP